MGIRLRLLLIGGTIALIAFGCIHIADGLSYRTPKVVTCESIQTSKPSDGWYTITGGYLSVAEGVFTYSKGSDAGSHTITELYVPLRTKQSLTDFSKKQAVPIDILVTTKDPGVLATFDKIKDASEAQVGKIPFTDLFVQRDVSGMIASSIHSISDEDSKALHEGMTNMSGDCLIINEGRASISRYWRSNASRRPHPRSTGDCLLSRKTSAWLTAAAGVSPFSERAVCRYCF